MSHPILPTRIRSQQIVETAPTFIALPKQFVGQFVGTTPDVLNQLFFKSHSSSVTVTNFLHGQDGQRLHILGNGNTTITNGTLIKTNTGANKVLAANKVYKFTFFTDTWYEDA